MTKPSQSTARAFQDAALTSPSAKPKRSVRRSVSPLVIRLTEEERARLEELAAGMTLSAYVRACVFGQEAKRRPKDAVAAIPR